MSQVRLRLGYSKSRSGCLRCKQRRVKCDEDVPCSACVRHGVACSLRGSVDSRASATSSLETSTEQHVEGTATENQRKRLHDLRPNAEPAIRTGGKVAKRCLREIRPIAQHIPPTTPYPYLTRLVDESAVREEDSRLSDLELMHHYTAIAWQTLPRAEEVYEIWQVITPQLALKHDFLLHQLLSLSAFHMAHVRHEDSRRYYTMAVQHQNAAIQRLMHILPDITVTNCDAVFIAASFLGMGSFAALSNSLDSPNRPDSGALLDVFYLLRGMNDILNSFEERLRQGCIAALLSHGQYSSTTPLLSVIIDELHDLLRIWNEDSDRGNDTDATTRTACHDAALTFLNCINSATASAPHPGIRVTLAWPLAISESYIELIRRRQADALDVLKRYCRVVDATGDDNWYLTGWGKSVLSEIEGRTVPAVPAAAET